MISRRYFVAPLQGVFSRIITYLEQGMDNCFLVDTFKHISSNRVFYMLTSESLSTAQIEHSMWIDFEMSQEQT
jgi:hypothetical protein